MRKYFQKEFNDDGGDSVTVDLIVSLITFIIIDKELVDMNAVNDDDIDVDVDDKTANWYDWCTGWEIIAKANFIEIKPFSCCWLTCKELVVEIFDDDLNGCRLFWNWYKRGELVNWTF